MKIAYFNAGIGRLTEASEKRIIDSREKGGCETRSLRVAPVSEGIETPETLHKQRVAFNPSGSPG